MVQDLRVRREGRGGVTLALDQEEAIFQREYWLEKSEVAKVKSFVLELHGIRCRNEQADVLISMVREAVWPAVSKAMRAFIEHPSESKMFQVRELFSASASIYGLASAYAYAVFINRASAPCSYMYAAVAYASVSAYTSVFTSASASVARIAANVADDTANDLIMMTCEKIGLPMSSAITPKNME